MVKLIRVREALQSSHFAYREVPDRTVIQLNGVAAAPWAVATRTLNTRERAKLVKLSYVYR